MEIANNFISEEDCLSLINYINSKELSLHENPNPKYDGRRMLWNPVDEECMSILGKYIVSIGRMMDTPLYPHDIALLKYYPGVGMALHSDHDGPCVGQCTYSSIMHISDDYTGGEITFPALNKTIKLKAGDLLFFPQIGDEWQHSVSDITSGERYSIITCWSPNKDMVREQYLDLV